MRNKTPALYRSTSSKRVLVRSVVLILYILIITLSLKSYNSPPENFLSGYVKEITKNYVLTETYANLQEDIPEYVVVYHPYNLDERSLITIRILNIDDFVIVQYYGKIFTPNSSNIGRIQRAYHIEKSGIVQEAIFTTQL